MSENTNDWEGMNLDEELENIVNEYTDQEGIDNNEDDKKEKKEKKEKKNLLSNLKNFNIKNIDFKNKKTIAIAIALLLFLIFIPFILIKTHNSSVKNSDQELIQKNTSGELDKSKYQIFKNGIKYALSGNDVKNKVATDWRSATIKYGETNDIDTFKNELVKINDTRKKALEKIPNDKYDINKYMIETLNIQKDYLNKAYEATSSEDATNIYNDWINNVNISRDNEYITILTSELNKVGITYQKTESDGKLSIKF